MDRVTIWAGGTFLAGLLVGAILVFPGDITHPFSASGPRGQILMHFDNRDASRLDLQVTLRDAAGRTILDETISAGPHRLTDRAAVNLLAGVYTLTVQNGGATARETFDVSGCRGDRYFETIFVVDATSVSATGPQCVAP